MSPDDVAFLAWVAKNYGEGVDRHWIRRNWPALRAAYEARQPIRASEPVEPARTYDRYSEI